MVNVFSQIKNIFISPYKLIKIQIPKEYTHKFLTKIDTMDFFTQTVVDPQSPKEQARIQDLIELFEDRRSRLVDVCYKLQIPISIKHDIKDEYFEYLSNLSDLKNEIDQFLEENEKTISSLYQKLNLLKKEERILSALSVLQREAKKDDFSIDLLSSSVRTHTFLGEIPASYEELIRFYLTELTAGKLFYWSTKTEKIDKKIMMCVTLVDFKNQINQILEENYFDSTELDITFLKSLDDFKETSNIKDLYSSVSRDITSIEKELENFSSEYKDKLSQLTSLSHFALLILTYEEKGRTTTNDFTIWGWIKENNIEKFNKAIGSFEFKTKFSILEDVPIKFKKYEEKPEEYTLQPSDHLIKTKDEKQIPHLPHRGVEVKGGFMFPKKASFVKLESSDKNSRRFVSFIHSQNSIHPIKIGSQKTERTSKLNEIRQELSQYNSRIRRIRDVLEIPSNNEEKGTKFQLVDGYSHSKAFIENFLRDYEEEIINLTADYNQLKKKWDHIDLILPFEEELRKKNLDLNLIEGGFQTKTYIGSIPKNHFKAVKFFLNEVTDGNILFWASDPSDPKRDEKNILLLSLEEYDMTISRVLNEYSFQPLEFDPALLQEKQALNKIKKELEKKIIQKEEELNKIRDEISDKIYALSELIDTETGRINTEEICQVAENKITIWGWVPSDGIKKLYKAKEKLEFEVEITLTEKVPLVNPSITKTGKLFKSIRGIVGGIGEPNPHEIDPYSIVRFTFPLLFGIMFADVGHGLMLTLIGLFLAIRKRRKKIKPDESITGYLYSGSELLVFCGLFATIFGFFFGSILGDEKLIPNLMHQIGIDWIPLINPLHDTQIFLTFSIILGFIMMQVGIWLKFVENLKYGHGFSSKIAPVILSLFYVGIFALLYTIIGANVESHVHEGLIKEGFVLPPIPGMNYIIYVTLALIPVLFIVEYLHAKSDGIMDAIDHIIALFSNTLSFSRLMALLLVHAILSGIPFTLIGYNLALVSPLTESAANWIIGVVFGLILIVPLEGLLSFLNSLRLHWVEWFTKFYVGDGKPYTPIVEKLEYIEFVSAKGS
ncbi:MAG: V-type ATPase 116kDa subunit family protein [Candidatus Thorarchaeota archaeon]